MVRTGFVGCGCLITAVAMGLACQAGFAMAAETPAAQAAVPAAAAPAIPARISTADFSTQPLLRHPVRENSSKMEYHL